MNLHPTSKRIWLVAAGFLVVLLFGQSAGESLVALTGGSNTAAPYTSLSYREPEIAAGGLVRGGAVDFVITNATGDEREYRWNATIDGRKVGHGTAVTDAATSSRVVTVELERTGKLVFSVEGLPQTLTGVVTPDSDPSQKKVRP